MSGGLDQLGRLAVFYVEMVNEHGSGAAPSAHPVAVWLARFDAATFDVLSFAPAPASSATVVYGVAVESDDSFSYLFGWSYDQFNLPDPTSPPPSQMFVARVPAKRFDLQPKYWNGIDWVASRAAAVPISTDLSGASNPMQPRLLEGDVDLGGQGRRLERLDRANRGRAGTRGSVEHGPNGDGSQPDAGRAYQHLCGSFDAVAIGHRQPRRGVVEQRVADGSVGVRQPDHLPATAVRTGRA